MNFNSKSEPSGARRTFRGSRGLLFLVLLITVGLSAGTYAQFAVVTLKLDTNRVAIGGTTTLHVFAQIAQAQRSSTERIFSWNVDLLNSSPVTAQPDFSKLLKPTSDNHPNTSSTGISDGGNRRGIYDSFLDRPGAGRDTPVELFSVPINGLAGGQAVFRIAAGSAPNGPSADFIIAPIEGDQPLIGGAYDTANVTLEVIDNSPCTPKLFIKQEIPAAGQNRVSISFTPCADRRHVVEFRDSLSTGSWQPLPGAPHDSGSVIDSATLRSRFYRLSATAR